MAQEKMYQEALDALQNGQRTRARDLFTRLLRSDSSRVDYWLWMSTLVDTDIERIYCLESAIRIDPANEAARRGLIILGVRQAEPDLSPAPPIHRKWEKQLDKQLISSKSIFHRFMDNPILRLITFLGVAFVMIGLVGNAIYSFQNKQASIVYYRVSPFPTQIPEFTRTPPPSQTLVTRSVTPTLIGPTPLWMFLTQTYTPIPAYVNTPHPRIEAYRIGINAYQRNHIETMLSYMQQASTMSPNDPDLIYYIGEAHRLLGNYAEALSFYQQSMSTCPTFAPAYLGRVLIRLSLNPSADVAEELLHVIQLDPSYIDAYLTRATFLLDHDEPSQALEDLATAESISPGLPMIYLLTAQAYLQLGDRIDALEYAQLAYDADRTLLPAYITLANSYLLNQAPEQALDYAEVYLRYKPEDSAGWSIIGQSYYLQGEDYYQQAIDAFNHAIEIDEENAESLRYRGLTYLALGDTRQAVNDLFIATELVHYQFDYAIDLAMAFWANGRLREAAITYTAAENHASSDAQLARVFYYRAQVYEENFSLWYARMDYQHLIDLPQEAVPMEWRQFAENRLSEINPPTPTSTPTCTSTCTQARTPTMTPTPRSTPTAISTQTLEIIHILTASQTLDATTLP